MTLTNDPTAEEPAPSEARRELARGTTVGRYLLLDLLGEGGMGVVYKAYDPELGRPIALKLLQTASDASTRQRDRLLREAQALARLQHPNVIAVHDVGLHSWEGGADVFIAMEFVEGQNVRQWLKAKPRGRAEILEVFLAAGEGLAAAHRAGLVHRDFKPDNVMVGDDGRVRVLDFGLARAAHNTTLDSSASLSGEHPLAAPAPASVPTPLPDPSQAAPTVSQKSARSRRARTESLSSSESGAHASGSLTPRLLSAPLTRVGAVVGTPRFMAPEQHMGDATDEKADQFAFCVSLYWCLYQDYPFPGKDFDELLDNMQARKFAEPPAGATVPRWIREVLLRGLEPGQAARYPSMVELLAALRADPAEKRRRFLRAALLVASIGALGGAAVAGGLAYQARRGAAEQARLAQQFGQEVEKIAAIARYAAFLPLHDTRVEMNTIRGRMDGLRERMRALGPVAAGPGHHALGRGWLALERYDEALAELQAAWATGYRSPELAYALGMVHGKLYERALADLQKTGDPKLDAARKDELAHAHRDPALRYLKEVGTHEVGVDAPEYVEGLMALYEQRYDDALGLARQAGERVSWLFEARTLEGDIHLVAGRELDWKGDPDGSLDQLRRAGESYRAAIAIAPSSAGALMGECQRLGGSAEIEVERDRTPETEVKEALAACAQAAQARPDDAAPFSAQARVWRLYAAYQAWHKGDEVAADHEVIRLAEQALARDPHEADAEQLIGFAHYGIGAHDAGHGGDPRPSLERAVEHARKALAINPNFLDAFRLLTLVYKTRGDYELTHGVDPRPSFSAAIDYAHKTLVQSPVGFRPWNNLGISLSAMGRWEMSHGLDPTHNFEKALEADEKVAQLSPTLDYAHANRCDVYANWSGYELRSGKDPRPRLDQAIASCQRAIELDGNYDGSHSNLGAVYLLYASWQLEHGVDPSDLIARARASVERAFAINAADSSIFNCLAEPALVEGRWLAASGRDPLPAFAKAEGFLKRALAASDGKDVEALNMSAELRRRRAEWRERHHQRPSAELREGLALVARALAENPTYADSSETAGALHLIDARTAANEGERTEALAKARAALEHALSINANLGHEIRPLLDEVTRLSTK
jgi:serine/threonine protein kinase